MKVTAVQPPAIRGGFCPPQNPFATRFVRPGAMPFLFSPPIDREALVAKLAELQWRGAIVGPHGSGKSTLLAELLPELNRVGRRVVQFTLHDGERRLPIALSDRALSDAQTIIVVDGYEQLNAASRRTLDRHCRRYATGLLVTSHEPTHLAQLYQTAVDCELMETIVDLLTRGDRRFVSATDVERAYCLHGQNAREALFSLYDLHERRWRELHERL
ncbi:MAG TPA: hypothetical protein VKB78_11040 [Pirellulales bacterium]|nr:hypothetical protein [Pirellulales bacterium]